MKYNVWLEIRDDFAFPADDPADDTELQAKNRETFDRLGDVAIITLYERRTQGPRSWDLYCLVYDDIPNDVELERVVERFKSENPGQTDVLGAWYWDGTQVGLTPVWTDVLVDYTIIDPAWDGTVPQVPNPAYNPDPDSNDYDPREFIDDPNFTPPTIVVQELEPQITGYTGTKLYNLAANISQYMPGGIPLSDVHLYWGQQPRDFS